ncbi:MAG TPA: serine/threonine-protein kinase [Labilithrix sp.]|nr:serine/threonine-protein kinase [Labilithrix sp.]
MNSTKLYDWGEPEPSPLELIDENKIYVSIGEIVAGKYRVERVLGVGGMAFVLSATHIELGEQFALKFLNEQFLRERTIIERFTQEAKAACRIRSEHVARVHDVGMHEGAPFLVMEHLMGRDLANVVAGSGALRIEDAVEYTMQACEALAVAHRHGIVHRDIKPENLFLVEHEGLPRVKVLDFGISKSMPCDAAPSSKLTGELTLGTPCYMAPEQIRAASSADARSDLWSLGVVLYELLAGTEAFRAPSVTEVCAAVLEREPEPLERLRPDVPRELAEVVARCLEKDPERRFRDVSELAVALLPFAPSRALVCAERACSIMTCAASPSSSDPRVSSVRPSKPMPSSIPSRLVSVGMTLSSEAPVVRSLDRSDAALRRRPNLEERAPSRRAIIAIFVATFSFTVFVAALLVAPSPAVEPSPLPPSPPAAAAVEVTAPTSVVSSSAPVISLVLSASSRPADPDPVAKVAPAPRRASPPPGPLPRARPTGSMSTPAEPPASSAATARASTPSVPTIELGY